MQNYDNLTGINPYQYNHLKTTKQIKVLLNNIVIYMYTLYEFILLPCIEWNFARDHCFY